ncbi:MAG: SRPBCC family protein [Acidimicrobiia bacterium]
MPSERVAVTRRIAAPAAAIFAIVSNPAGHVEVDGSGMLEAATDARPIHEVGETFDMDMDRAPLGDVPSMGKYKVRNTVTQIVPDRLFEWTIGTVDRPSVGHVYGWQLEPVSDDETDVTNYCDWSGISDEMRSRSEGRWPIVPVEMLEKSVENLERIATTG